MVAYRIGWKMGSTAIATNVAATIILIPIGFAGISRTPIGKEYSRCGVLRPGLAVSSSGLV